MRHYGKIFAMLALCAASLLVATDFAEARRAGGFSSFGSRGSRTFSTPSITRTAPNTATGIQRSMTPQSSAARQNSTGFGRTGGLFGGLGGGILGGLLMGGLFGMMLGHGFGGGFGFIGMMLQIFLLVMLGSWLLRRFGGQSTASAGSNRAAGFGGGHAPDTSMRNGPAFNIPKMGSGIGSGSFGGSGATMTAQKDIDIPQEDLDTFEQMLVKVQAAYGNEDYAALRELTTPEAMSYLAEELSESATQGRRNVVSDVKLLQGDVSEAWSEGSTDYATVAMRYESVDYMADRASGKILLGETDEIGESIEIWTFRRDNGGPWKVSAIQSTN